MLHEYAFAPDLLKQWAANGRDYHEFFREYGLGSPRLSSAFPRLTAHKFRNYYLSRGPADEQSGQARRYTEMIYHLAETLVYRDGFTCRAGEWNQDVVEEDARVPFHAVLSPRSLDSPRCLTPESMYVPDSAWGHNRQGTVARSYEKIAPYLKDMLRLASKNVVVVDSYGWNEKSTQFVAQVIADVCLDRVFSDLPRVSVFFKEKYDKSNPTASVVKVNIQKKLTEGALGIDLRVTELREKEGEDVFHNRCVFTEHGGLVLGHGVDLTEDPNHSDEIFLMGKDIYEKKCNQFLVESCFEVVSQS